MVVDTAPIIRATGATRNWTPTPPPRRRRMAERSHTVDAQQAALDWRPFTWKWRRCRSLTELDVRNSRPDLSTGAVKPQTPITRRTDSPDPGLPPLQPKIIRTITKRPARPPPPTAIPHSLSTS